MRSAASVREINFVKVGAVAAFLLAATLIAAIAISIGLSDATPRTETRQFLDDVADQKKAEIAVAWLFTFASVTLFLFVVGLYYGLRRWGEDYMRFAALTGVVAAVLAALSQVPQAVFAAYIVPNWADPGLSPAARDVLLSEAKILWWTGDAIFSMFNVMIGITLIAASHVMLPLRETLWKGLGWFAIVIGLVEIIAAFTLAAEAFTIALMVGNILLIVWLLGVGVGLLRLREEAT